jgi:hypothetical protein
VARRGRVKTEKRVGIERGAATQFKLTRDETLDWLAHTPAYRELIRSRISEAQKRRRSLDQKRDRDYARHDRDQLGREIEGCG